MTLMRRHPVWTVVLGVHAGVVLVLTVVVLVLLLPTLGEADANIGAGIAALPLLVLGLPWSLPVIGDVDGLESLPAAVRYLIVFGSAPLNVVLHAIVFAAVDRRATARSRAAQAPLA